MKHHPMGPICPLLLISLALINLLPPGVQARSVPNGKQALPAGPSEARAPPVYRAQPLQVVGLDSTLADASIRSNRPGDLNTAAGHHYHHKHSVHGWLKMGAHSGKKGAFGWHAKYPVGGKGRR